MDISLKNRVAVITGAGGGLGRAYALELAGRGARVVVNDLAGSSEEMSRPALEVVEEIKAAGGEAVADFNSVTAEESAARIVDTALQHYGKVDILINNAGVLRDRSFSRMTAFEFDEVLKVHLYGAFYATKAVFPYMKKMKYGRIIFTTSITGLYGNFGQVNYASAKLGLVGFMNSLKEEGARDNIFINTVSPAAATQAAAAVYPSGLSQRFNPAYVAPLVAYLCSDKCEEGGQIITAGGGYYTKVQVVEGKGVFFEDESVTAEMIAAKFGAILDMEEVDVFSSACAALKKMFTFYSPE